MKREDVQSTVFEAGGGSRWPGHLQPGDGPDGRGGAILPLR